MKLSEAIAAYEGGQAKYEWFKHYDENGVPQCACALGAAWLMATDDPTNTYQANHMSLGRLYDVDMEQRLELQGETYGLNHCIAVMNDNFGWSFEKIADWLEAHGL